MTEKLTDLEGVGEQKAQQLEKNGFNDFISLAASSAGDVDYKTNIGQKTAQKAIASAREHLDMNFESATDVEKKRSKRNKIPTGVDEVDELLGGGLETQSLTELYGEYGGGKSQWAFQLAVNVQLPKERGGSNKGCLYIDTESTFRPERIRQMANAADLDADKVLDNIKVARAYNSSHQMVLVKDADEVLSENDIGLVVVDSLTGPFRSDYTGRGELAERQQKLSSHLSDLQRLADVHNVAVLVTNQVLADPSQNWGDPTKAVGGHVLHHATATRLYLRRGKDDSRVCKLVDSPSQPVGEAPFQITEKGLEKW